MPIDPEFVKVRIDLEESELHDHVAETLWAEPKGLDLYVLENSPVYADGYSYLDTVLAIAVENDFPQVVEVISPSGHSTIRIYKLEDTDDDKFQEYLDNLVELGSIYEGLHNIHFALDIAPETDIAPIFSLLEAGSDQGVWSFEHSNLI